MRGEIGGGIQLDGIQVYDRAVRMMPDTVESTARQRHRANRHHRSPGQLTDPAEDYANRSTRATPYSSTASNNSATPPRPRYRWRWAPVSPSGPFRDRSDDVWSRTEPARHGAEYRSTTTSPMPWRLERVRAMGRSSRTQGLPDHRGLSRRRRRSRHAARRSATPRHCELPGEGQAGRRRRRSDSSGGRRRQRHARADLCRRAGRTAAMLDDIARALRRAGCAGAQRIRRIGAGRRSRLCDAAQLRCAGAAGPAGASADVAPAGESSLSPATWRTSYGRKPVPADYLPIAASKQAGEDALRGMLNDFEASGHFVRRGIRRHDRGTITVRLFERRDPEAVAARRAARRCRPCRSSRARSFAPSKSPFRMASHLCRWPGLSGLAGIVRIRLAAPPLRITLYM